MFAGQRFDVTQAQPAESAAPAPQWPERLAPEQVGSRSLAPFILPLLADPRRDLPFIGDLKDRLIDLTVQMARKHTEGYGRILADHDGVVTAATLADLPFVTRSELSAHRDSFVARITTFAFASFTGGTTSQAPLMVERALEEQVYLGNLLRDAIAQPTSDVAPLGLVAVNGSHGEVFRIPGRGYAFSVNFEQEASFRKAAWLLGQSFAFPGFDDRIGFIQGYFEFIHLLVLYMKENGIACPPGQVRNVACYGMAIPPSRRAEVAEFFGAPVSDNFSLSEAHGSAPHRATDDTYAFSPFIHAEVVDVHTGRPVERGSGELVVTTLFPFTQRFPLIRYRTGDLVFTPGRVADGPLFRVRGRLLQSVRLRDGHLLSRGDVLLALEELPFVARLASLTKAVRTGSIAAGPKFSLVALPEGGAKVVAEIAPAARADLTGDSEVLAQRIRAKIAAVLPDDTQVVLAEAPELLSIELVDRLD